MIENHIKIKCDLCGKYTKKDYHKGTFTKLINLIFFFDYSNTHLCKICALDVKKFIRNKRRNIK